MEQTSVALTSMAASSGIGTGPAHTLAVGRWNMETEGLGDMKEVRGYFA